MRRSRILLTIIAVVTCSITCAGLGVIEVAPTVVRWCSLPTQAVSLNNAPNIRSHAGEEPAYRTGRHQRGTIIQTSGDTARLSLLFIGDIMQHDTQIAAAFDPLTGKYDYRECFQEVKPVFESADLTIANLEVTLGGAPYKGYPNFSAPDELLETLIWSGVDVLVTANNHCLDRGKKGLQRTVSVLDTFKIPHTGTFVDSLHRSFSYPLLLEKNGFRISLLNYTYGTNGIVVTKPNIVNYIDTVQIAHDIVKAKAQNPDFIIAFVHWGDEYQRLPNKAQKSLTEFCFKHGVKLVIGAHPHVLQPMEWRKDQDQLVAYSLGNFVSGQSSRYKNGGTMLYVNMEKVITDTLQTQSKISGADYKLQYVYRDGKRKYYVLPVQEFENDTVKVKEKLAQMSLKEFAFDSRKLFADHNINIVEHQGSLRDSVYFILVQRIDSTFSVEKISSIDSLSSVYSMLKFYGIKKQTAGGTNIMSVGEFFDKEIALRALSDLRQQLPAMKAMLVRRRKS